MMKRMIVVAVVTSAVTLAIVFGIRASPDALAVIIGVVLGVVASVPTTFLITYMLTRSNNIHPPSAPPQQFSAHPPVVVINATDKPGVSTPPGLPAPGPAVQGRRWTVIGDTGTEDE